MSSLLSSKEEITVYGWLHRKPKAVSKSLCFAILRDQNGDLCQLLDQNEPLLLKGGQIENPVVITGHIEKRLPPKNVKNENQDESNEIKWDISVKTTNILNETDSIITKLKSPKAHVKVIPAKYRYLELRNKYYQDALKLRSFIAKQFRKNLENLGFTEIETPLLFKSTPEGANEFLVPTKSKGLMYALPQSPQQYKQLLMASGIPKYYQIAKCFRDEDLRKDRQPEFTQVDLEMSFSNGADVRETVEKVVNNVINKSINKPFYIPSDNNTLIDINSVKNENGVGILPKLKYMDALSKFGIDKPDLRSTIIFNELTKYSKAIGEPDYPIFEICILKNALNLKGDTNKSIPESLTSSREYKTRNPIIMAINNEQDANNWHKSFESIAEFTKDDSLIKEMYESLNIEPGDIVAGSTRQSVPYENPTPLGRFRQLSIDEFKGFYERTIIDSNGQEQKIDDKTFVGSWVVDFPLFNPVEIKHKASHLYPKFDYKSFVSTHHPFTMVHADDYDFLESTDTVLKARGQHYDLVINGVEVGGGSTRVHDVNLQLYIFKKILGIEDPHKKFDHLLEAFGTGCPPHAGLAIGFDRFVAMMVGTPSIRDVIAFPKTMTGVDPVVRSPSQVTNQQLSEYHIKIDTEA